MSSPSVRVNCNINEDAAKILLELKKRGVIQSNREAVVQGLFALHEKVIKVDLEKARLKDLAEQKVYLKPWDEVIGTLAGIENDDSEITALLTCNYQKHIAITIPKNQPETKKLQKLIGQKIAILKTDNADKPLAIRTFTETPDTHNITCALLQFRKSFLWVAFKAVAFNLALWQSGLRLGGGFSGR